MRTTDDIDELYAKPVIIPSIVQDLTGFDGSLAAQGLTTKLRNMTQCAVPNNPTRRTYWPCTFQGGVWGR